MNTATSLGKYQILGELGKGGFATVYRARDPDLGREVALKVLDPLLTRDPVWVARFRREARAVASLDHPRVVTVHEIGQAEGSLYIAMRLVEGGSLKQRIETQGALPWDEVVRLTGQIAEALDFAHGQGVLHRDLKPANVLLDARLGAVLTDFGFASLVADNSLSISMSGGVVGTPAYIAPEVWEGDDPTPQTDIYALGCIVYELVSGQALFGGASTPAVMRAHFQPRKLPETWPEGTPNELTDILLTALALDPVSRYARAGELAAALAMLGEDTLAGPYAQLNKAVASGRWQDALALAGQIRGVDETYRDVAALEAAALAGHDREARSQQAAEWRAEAEHALAEGDLKTAGLALNKWQELASDDDDIAEFQARLAQQVHGPMQTSAQQEAREEDLRLAPIMPPPDRVPPGSDGLSPEQNGNRRPAWLGLALSAVAIVAAVLLFLRVRSPETPSVTSVPSSVAQVTATEAPARATTTESATATATWTLRATDTPPAATPTPSDTWTPVPDTATPTVSPTATRTPNATPTSTQATTLISSQATTTPTRRIVVQTPITSATQSPAAGVVGYQQAPVPVMPLDGTSAAINQEFGWRWDGPPLRDDERFDWRLFRTRSGENVVDVRAVPQQGLYYQFGSLPDGEYYWSVRVIRLDRDGRFSDVVSPESSRLLIRWNGTQPTRRGWCLKCLLLCTV